ncbi:MAG TPA: hypothetical protein VF593_14035 [Chthoniobacteraceae bacterium]|jgi:hypothetical protein
MASNFSNLGFRIESPQEFHDLTKRAAGNSTPVPTYVGGAYLHSSTPEGVELWTQVSPDKELIGCNPHFVGDSKFLPEGGFAVEITRIISVDGAPLDGRLVGTIASDDASGCPIVFDVPDFRQYAARLTLPTRARVQLAALPHEFSASPTGDAFLADQASALAGPGMAAESFIPSGTFKPGGEAIEAPVAQAVLTGRILASERRTNTFSGLPFYALTVRTLGGVMDMAVDPSLVSREPVVGGVVFGSFWLSGRLLEPLPPPPVAKTSATPPPLPKTAPDKKSKWMFNPFKKRKPVLPDGPHPQHRNYARMAVPLALTSQRSGFLGMLMTEQATQTMRENWQRGAARILPPEQLISPAALSVEAFHHKQHLCALIVFPPPNAPGEAHFGFIVAGPGPSGDWAPEVRAALPVRYFLLERSTSDTPTIFEWRPSHTQGEEVFDSHGSGPSPLNPMDFVETIFKRFCGL